MTNEQIIAHKVKQKSVTLNWYKQINEWTETMNRILQHFKVSLHKLLTHTDYKGEKGEDIYKE